ncbi:50S ribosomal protein L6 [Gloeobacter violaceus]|uniref:Large ribosomal subunit protein uL6 n=1 Tax=Gloeobacter violaceus (strain ATCC 29082 / PCC 7421) TaxID=251221 RepID=RL6_GLOVI|nr:50S ribosomal protein L6 [Gloeobacter violaceus]Q7NEG7.1 RecName: Full=Large ribosomal subunit protein uL6; AltName: Full=50S ribosomal protein L6 [Gloeobacter violaceus PCC 7421]BAC91853.1 50S ribosomal protein L6 [Gloeobacter violaceus PCC 7421]
MSRIGKLPIAIPPKVEVTLDGRRVVVKGPKGTLDLTLPDSVEVVREDGRLLVTRRGESRRAREQHGLGRTLVANMVTGVTTGFTKPMQIAGVGYRVALTGRKLTINAGFSHPIEIELPAGIDIEVDPKASAIAGTRNQQGFNFVIKGFDKQAVGDLAAKIRDIRPPEPYKGKGIRYTAEKILLKAGKSGKK